MTRLVLHDKKLPVIHSVKSALVRTGALLASVLTLASGACGLSNLRITGNDEKVGNSVIAVTEAPTVQPDVDYDDDIAGGEEAGFDDAFDYDSVHVLADTLIESEADEIVGGGIQKPDEESMVVLADSVLPEPIILEPAIPEPTIVVEVENEDIGPCKGCEEHFAQLEEIPTETIAPVEPTVAPEPTIVVEEEIDDFIGRGTPGPDME